MDERHSAVEGIINDRGYRGRYYITRLAGESPTAPLEIDAYMAMYADQDGFTCRFARWEFAPQDITGWYFVLQLNQLAIPADASGLPVPEGSLLRLALACLGGQDIPVAIAVRATCIADGEPRIALFCLAELSSDTAFAALKATAYERYFV